MAEFYIDAGMIGVIVGMFLLGGFYRYLYLLAQHPTLLTTTFYCFFTSYQFYLLRGSLMTVTNFLFVAVFVIAAIYYFRKILFSSSSQLELPMPVLKGAFQ
jgi:hypothetical protein